MSLIIPSVATLKPEMRLAEAVSQFEASLSPAQKAEFRTDRSKALKSPPDTSNVMRLTADIDRSQRAGGRCFGPRFTNFLHGVQQFAALGDVLVGGSQNIVACGVWTIVRTSLLAIVASSSYLESLSLTFMKFGRSVPRHQALALLYPRSRPLQSQICEYFIVVVRLCHRIMAFSQKSTFSKMAATLNDEDMKSIHSELNHWALSIGDELELLMAKGIEKEAQESTMFRELSARFSRANKHHQSLAERIRILDLLSDYDYEITWKQTRKKGNTKAFAQTQEYRDWKDSAVSSTLVYTGKLGSGKSVILANMVDDLTIHVQGTNATVVYFFCRHDISQSIGERTVIGALGRQILRAVPDLSGLTVADKIHLSSYDVISLLKQAVPPSSRIYIVLDGLDLCAHPDRDQTSAALNTLQQLWKTTICISYRLEPNVTTDLPQFWNKFIVPQPDNNPDIEAFIEAELERCINTGMLSLGDPGLKYEIQDALIKGSHGMFLWVTLQIHSVCSMMTDEEIREALENLPQDLMQIYNQILERKLLPGHAYRDKIFKLVLVAKRPLTVHEMREALSVTPGDTVWNPSKLLNDVDRPLKACGCLITVDEEDLTIRTVHPSVDMFILTRDFKAHNPPRDLADIMDDAHTLMLSVIVTYLNYGIFGTELSTRLPVLDISAAPSTVIESIPNIAGWARGMVRMSVATKKKARFDASRTVDKCSLSQATLGQNESYFHKYATAFALQHIPLVPQVPQEILELFASLLMRDDIIDPLRENMYRFLRLTVLYKPSFFSYIPYPYIQHVKVFEWCQLFDFATENNRTFYIEDYLGTIDRSIQCFSKQYESFGCGTLIDPETICHCIRKHYNEIAKRLIYLWKVYNSETFSHRMITTAVKYKNYFILAETLLPVRGGKDSLVEAEKHLSAELAANKDRKIRKSDRAVRGLTLRFCCEEESCTGCAPVPDDDSKILVGRRL